MHNVVYYFITNTCIVCNTMGRCKNLFNNIRSIQLIIFNLKSKFLKDMKFSSRLKKAFTLAKFFGFLLSWSECWNASLPY